jgi:hypothetical protein
MVRFDLIALLEMISPITNLIFDFIASLGTAGFT